MALEVDILASPILQVRNLKLGETGNLWSYRISKILSLDGNLEFWLQNYSFYSLCWAVL